MHSSDLHNGNVFFVEGPQKDGMVTLKANLFDWGKVDWANGDNNEDTESNEIVDLVSTVTDVRNFSHNCSHQAEKLMSSLEKGYGLGLLKNRPYRDFSDDNNCFESKYKQ